MWTWEMLQQRRAVGVRKFVLACTMIVLPAALAPGVVRFSGQYLEPSVMFGGATNVALIGSIAVAGSSVVGEATGPILAILTYVALLLTQQAFPGLATLLPIWTAASGHGPHLYFVVISAALAVTIWGQSLGRSGLSNRLRRHDGME